MTLSLYNTLLRTKEAFAPIDPAHVKLYVCGPTVYDYAHIGNARTFSAFDLLARLLKHLYPQVTYARNITDVDDKIIERSNQSGEPIDSVTARTTAQFHADMDDLGLLRPDIEPRATRHIGDMIAMIEALIAKGFAYAAEGHALFNVPAMSDYGQLSRRSQDELIAGARVEVAPYKKSPADFVLWKPAKDGEPGWDSPWGKGRPGWHIECSAMTAAHFGEVFDIHGGGLDLIFPHHENEIAQSRCAHGTAVMANVWLHSGFLTIAGDKMSKSLGNFYTVRELLDEFPGEALRLAILSAHYRQPLDFTKEKVAQARQTLDRWYGVLRAAGDVPAGNIPAEFMSALMDDLNTPLAISVLHELANAYHKAGDDAGRMASASALKAATNLLGFLTQAPEAWFKWQPAGASGLDDAAIEQAIADRLAARKAKNFAEADRIRNDLAAQGVILEDGPKGTTWKRG
ncbi:cysteine--tRNA ligase [Niveispirillum cyanobacteriorum]|uniref:Cysteine--tRNA ligase n=1 Tax=Niveispirillum cyanobacteriorum TaxID=1612173 RepID=A0A2K9N877_9PROT|nr:cysteine--tRNA ligase [Niveispirillum cyanobacteriorum]AUN29340.1 cysteine--tRNA ligase [Niveispirillum cyanobacteriorum]GGE65068.1 cysteine--tRNA ligase [Niveispirillum cyanobacteriorum]